MDFRLGIGLLLFVIYWVLLSRLVEVILEEPRWKKNVWVFVGMFNAFVVFLAFAVWKMALLSLLIMMVLMLLEFAVFYKNKFSAYLLCTLACAIHVLSIFTIIMGFITLKTGFNPGEILKDRAMWLTSVIFAFAVLDLSIILAIRFVPLSKVKVISQHQEQQWFMNAWMVVNNLALLYGADTFLSPGYQQYTADNQMMNAVTAMISLYVILFFSIKTSTILGYKEKSIALEQAIQQEQQYRNSMVKDALASYEINVSQDMIIKGFEDKYDEWGDLVYQYSEMLMSMSKNLIYSDDVGEFIRKHTRENLIKMFKSGQSEFTVEYRRLLDNGNFIWVRAMINLVKDIETDDIKGFVCIKDIDDEKKNHLELQRMAERDSLTGLYNKNMTQKLIEEQLLLGQKNTESAMFMIDVDNFKDINDCLGHFYGDAVLCELADKLGSIFDSKDVVGRIGGDEFMVFLKDGNNTQKTEEKAEEIGKAFHITYKGLNDEEYTISSSIGICFFPQDGCSFHDLYRHADIALYTAKSGGKNTYIIYDGREFSGYTSLRTEIQTLGNISQKSFRHNRIEYVFKMLYHSENPVAAIHSALELVASHFSFERGYIFETSEDGKTTSNTFEWCDKGVNPEKNNLQKLPIETVATANSNFCNNGTFILKSLDDLAPLERAVLEPQGIKSMFQFGIFDKNNLLGFIGFDNCRNETVPSDIEIDEITTICNILATFFVKQHIDEAAAKDLVARQEVMNHLESYIYVINTNTFEVLFMNEKIQKLVNETLNKTACYSFFRGNATQCENCPLTMLDSNQEKRVICEIYNEKLNIWMEATASSLRWTDGSMVALINCVDITKQKETHLSHIRQLENLAYVDALTGCKTYHKFKADAQIILENQQTAMHYLVKLDIDNFKLINQIYGFEKGNEILCCVAEAIEKTTRNEDEIFARITNDEFIALFTVQEKADIEMLYHNFLHHFNTLLGTDFPFKFNFPHGRFIIEPGSMERMDMNEIFEKANIAHKAAKLDKTLDFAFYDEYMTKEALHEKEIENRMANALVNEEFTAYLQPKYYLEDETIGGAEALTRWKNENEDLFYPDSFIPIFEKNGFIIKLDFYIFKKVCYIIKSWIAAGIEPVTVSVNFSRLHLGNVNFVNELCEVVDDAGIDRKYLEIEITETVIYENIDKLAILLNQVHSSGFSMSMDDFGSGYSSLGMLKDISVDVIKIDRSFFANQRDIMRSKTVVGSVIQMASSLGIGTVAEGVEDQEHIDFLRELHCDMVQGYYYAKPMPVENFTKLIIRQNEKG